MRIDREIAATRFRAAHNQFRSTGRQWTLVSAFGIGFITSVLPAPIHGETWFAPPVTTPLPMEPRVLATGHFNSDAHGDVVVGAATGTTEVAYILLGDGTGQLTLDTTLPISKPWWRIAVGDFNGDSRDDIAAAEMPVKVFYADLNHEYSTAVSVPNGLVTSEYWQMLARDIDGDGFDDLAGSVPGAPPEGKIYINWGGPDGLQSNPTILQVNMVDDEQCWLWELSAIYQYDIVDMNDDSLVDVVLTATWEYPEFCSEQRRGIGIWFNATGRSFQSAPLWLERSPCETHQQYNRPIVGWIGLDPWPDILYIADGDYLDQWRGVAYNTWQHTPNTGVPIGTHRIERLDSDPRDDLLASSYTGLRIYRGTWDGAFVVVDTLNPAVTRYDLLDFDSDDDLDVASIDGALRTVQLWGNVAPEPSAIQAGAPRSRIALEVLPPVTGGDPVKFIWRRSNEDRFGPRGEFRVWNASGRLVWSSSVRGTPTTSLSDEVTWRLDTLDGDPVSSGIYFVGVIGLAHRARIVVIR